MSKINYHDAHFMLSVANVKQLPEDSGCEVAFAGRSNAGKSSALNALTNIKRLARTSKTPGRTQLINMFGLQDNYRLVDLPGYGYAKVPKAIKSQWQKLLLAYFERRQCLRGLIVIMDIRHPMKVYDQELLQWAKHYDLPVHILLNKADKLSRGAALTTLHQVKKQLAQLQSTASVQIFSAAKKLGLDQLKIKLDDWFNV